MKGAVFGFFSIRICRNKIYFKKGYKGMKQLYTKLCIAALFLPTFAALASCSSSCSTSCSDSNDYNLVVPYFSPRSQSVDLARQLVGVTDIIDELTCSDKCWPGFIGTTFEFEKTFRSPDITRRLFGPSLNGSCQSINISGSAVTDRGDNDWLADYFGLSPQFQSVINFNPRVTTFVGDIQGYVRLDQWLCGLYFYIHAPITSTKWNLHVCEDVKNDGGTTGYAEGYFAPGAIGANKLLSSFSEFVSGKDVPTLTGTDALGNSFSETFQNLQYARWAVDPCDSLTKTGLADLRMWLGYDWLNCERYSFGIGAVLAAPTGNRPHARYLFEPIVGNGHHWELGALIKGDYVLWRGCDDTHRVTLFSQANITHLFKAKQKRTFDLKGKPLSRYMLAEQLTANNSSPYLYGNPQPDTEPGSTLSEYKFAKEFAPVANLTTLCVDVSTNVQIDWATMLTYSRCNFTFDLGYELWYRGKESIKTNCDTTNLIAANTWALKGDASVFGFLNATLGNIPQGTPVALGATESLATIHQGTNSSLANPTTNPGIDKAQYALASNTNTNPVNFEGIVNSTTLALQTRTSIQSVFLSGDDIDICSAETKGFSNKVFANVSHFWDCACWRPFLGLGAMGEFNRKNHCCSTESAFSQWGVWIKGGFVF